MFVLDWASFKAFVDAKRLSIQYAEDASFYFLIADNFSCKISKTLEGDTPVLDDFEDNYKAAGNKSENTTNAVSTPAHIAVGTSAVQLDSSTLDKRIDVIVEAHNKDLYLGFSNAVTTSSGYFLFLKKGRVVCLNLGPDVHLWAISGTASIDTHDVIVTQGAE